MKFEMIALVKKTYLADSPNSFISHETERLELTFDGLPGDRHFGALKPADSRNPYVQRGTPVRNARQVSIVSEEDLQTVADRLGIPCVQPEWLGANLLVSGIPELSFLPPSTRMVFPDLAVLVVEGENNPCRGPAEVVQSHYPEVPGLAAAFPTEALHRRGIVAWVEHPGTIYPGGAVRLIIPELHPYLPVKQREERNGTGPV